MNGEEASNDDGGHIGDAVAIAMIISATLIALATITAVSVTTYTLPVSSATPMCAAIGLLGSGLIGAVFGLQARIRRGQQAAQIRTATVRTMIRGIPDEVVKKINGGADHVVENRCDSIARQAAAAMYEQMRANGWRPPP